LTDYQYLRIGITLVHEMHFSDVDTNTLHERVKTASVPRLRLLVACALLLSWEG
jgi:hypothetical protein